MDSTLYIIFLLMVKKNVFQEVNENFGRSKSLKKKTKTSTSNFSLIMKLLKSM